MKPPRKKADFALLLEEDPEASADSPPADDESLEDDFEEEDSEGDFGSDLEDPLAATGDDEAAPTIDPEQAALCEALGFSEPDQQQALIDLIKLVNAPEMGATDSGGDFPALPESTY